MSKLESKIGKIPKKASTIYEFMADFRNFETLLPGDKVQMNHIDDSNIHFKIPALGEVKLEIAEKRPNDLIKISGNASDGSLIHFWAQIKEVGAEDSRIKLTMETKLKPMLQMMANKPLKQLLNTMIEKLESFNFE